MQRKAKKHSGRNVPAKRGSSAVRRPSGPDETIIATGRQQLADDQLAAVAGGRKAGESPKEYLRFELKEAMVTSVAWEK